MSNRLLMFISWPALVVGASLASAGCESTSHGAEAQPTLTATQAAKVEAPVPVSLAPVVSVPAAPTIRAMGRVTHDRDVKLAFKTGGIVAEVLVAEGQRVTAGEVVARLDAREIDAAVAQASAGLAKARRDLTRADGLAREQVIPGSTADDAQTAARVAAAQLAGARVNLESATLLAPVSGVIVKRLSEPGEVVGPGMPVLVIGADASDGATLVEVGIPARDALLVAVGDAATVTLDGVAEPARAIVSELAPTLTPGTDEVLVTLRLVEHLAVPRGLVARLELAPTRGGSVPAIPIRAIVEGEGRAASVYVLGPDGAHVERRAVTVGDVRSDGLVTLRSGLDAASRVVDAGTAWLEPGARVTVIGETETSAGERRP